MTPDSRSSGVGRMTRDHHLVLSPAFRSLPPPLIIIGMHRSGTSLVSGMLSLLGVYMDPAMSKILENSTGAPPSQDVRRLGYGEADAFRRLNDSLLLCAGADWRNVDGFLEQRSHPAFRAWCLMQMQAAALTSLRTAYLANAPAGFGKESRWGWKDPRNSVTLPLWLRLFPSAKVIHIRRNTHGVVESLVRRDATFPAATETPSSPGLAVRLKRVLSDPAYATAALRRRLGDLPRGTSSSATARAHYYRLTDVYLRECARAQSEVESYLELSFEDIMTDPRASAKRMADFAGISPSKAQIDGTVSFVERPQPKLDLTRPAASIRRPEVTSRSRRCQESCSIRITTR